MRRHRLFVASILIASSAAALPLTSGIANAATVTGGGCTTTPAPKQYLDNSAIFAQWQGCIGVNGTSIVAHANSTVSWPAGGTNACDIVLEVYQDGKDIGQKLVACNVNNGSNTSSFGVAAGHLYTFRWYVYVYHNAAYSTLSASSPALSYIGGSVKALAAVSAAEVQVWNHAQYATGGMTATYVDSSNIVHNGLFDCSGLTKYAYGQAGLTINRTSEEQYSEGFSSVEPGGTINTAKLLPGDLLFYVGDGTYPKPGHEAMYLGNNMLVEAPYTGQPVWAKSVSIETTGFMGAVRPAP